MPLRLLIVNDSAEETEALATLLNKGGYDCSCSRIETAAELEEHLKSSQWDMVISEYHLAHVTGLTALRIVRSIAPELPVIFRTKAVNASNRMHALNEGADDFIEKSQNARFLEAIETALKKRRVSEGISRQPLLQQANPSPLKPQTADLSSRLLLGFSVVFVMVALLWGVFEWRHYTGGSHSSVEAVYFMVLLIVGTILWVLFRSIIHAVRILQNASLLLTHGDVATPVPPLNFRELNDTAQSLETLRRMIQKDFDALENESEKRQHAVDTLRQSQVKQARQMEVINRRANELSMLSKLSGTLQTCKEYEEAYDSIYLLMPKLLPFTVGGLYILNEAADTMEPVAVWGETLTGATSFVTDDCYALRKGQVHRVKNPGVELHCRHMKKILPASTSVCIPMIAQGRIFGLLHLQEKLPASDNPAETAEDSFHLAVTAAEQLSLSLANLKLNRALRDQSVRDALTRLFNRRFMDESLAKEIARARRSGASVGIIMIDIDHFKRFNDTYGHDAGDMVLQSAGSYISHHVREGDIACRYGGEEFILILPGASLDVAYVRAEELRKGIQSLQITHSGKTLEPITLSLGIAAFPEHGRTGDLVIQAADAALYSAKHNGRNRSIKAAASKNSL